MPLDGQRDLVTEPEDFRVGGPKPRAAMVLVFPGEQATQLAGVAVDFAQPFALPSAFDGIGLRGLLRRSFPVAIEA